MDINNYSYISDTNKIVNIAKSNDDMIYFDRDYSYLFQETCYIVQNVLIDDSFKVFPVDTSEGWNTERIAYGKAAEYFNSLVSESESIPLF